MCRLDREDGIARPIRTSPLAGRGGDGNAAPVVLPPATRIGRSVSERWLPQRRAGQMVRTCSEPPRYKTAMLGTTALTISGSWSSSVATDYRLNDSSLIQ